MGLRFAKKIDFSKIRYEIVQHFNSVLFCHYPFSIFLPLSFLLSRPFYSCYLLRYIFLQAAIKSFVLIIAKA